MRLRYILYRNEGIGTHLLSLGLDYLGVRVTLITVLEIYVGMYSSSFAKYNFKLTNKLYNYYGNGLV